MPTPTATSPRRSSRQETQRSVGVIARHAKELRFLLRSRLLISTGVMFCFWALLPVGSLLHMYDPGQPPAVSYTLIFQTITGVGIGLVGLYLWLRPPEEVRTLRIMEFAVFGAGFLILAITNWYFIHRFGLAAPPISAVRHPVVDLGGTRMDPATVRWMVFIVGYGTLIPNTAKRTGVVAIGIAAAYIAMLVWQAAIAGVAGRDLPHLLLYPIVWMVVGCVIAIFGSYRVSLLQQRVQDAERLGQYRIQQRLGSGGMGDVYLAEHVTLKQPFAVKILSPDRMNDPRQLLRFEREVQAMARLEHWNTVEVYDFGHGADGSFYYVMEYLPGLTLEQMVAKSGPMPGARAIHFLRQICGALQEAHDQGLLHRDIKPANIIVSERAGVHDVAKLLDFGLVKHFEDPGDTALTVDGAIAGTPAYMSPEQAAGRGEGDARSDIYSLGAVGYFLLTGRPLFTGRSATQILAAHMYEEPKPITQFRSDIDPVTLSVIAKCLKKDPVERYADAKTLAHALGDCDSCGTWSQAEAAAWWAKYGPRTLSS
jgi:hypothetical protein